ncbi:MAG: restriction endonuclease, partial [Bacteroidota bacterium]|nr:restriction endonuclease [Bacteroidota bacterium]
QKNLVHKERFYIKHSVYDKHHLLHQILYKTILLLKEVNYTFTLGSKINGLLLLFPEMSDINVNEAVFSKIRYNRKTKEYKKAIEISRLLLLNYHPDLSNGRNDVLALMFDMNLLWEEFVLVSLRKNKELNVKGQRKKYFWKPDGGRKRTIRPDIKLSHEEKNYIIDTKWKLVERKPSMDDIRQMYVYHQYFDAEKVALLYPGKKDYISGNYVDKTKQNTLTDMECGLMFTKHTSSVAEWQKEINQRVFDWIKK